jgi:uncharacterized protein (UPF0332 family)
MASRHTAELWDSLANEARRAALSLGIQHPRASANRLYYARFANAHAELLRAGQRPRSGFGTWSHAELPTLVRTHLRDRHLEQRLRVARTLRTIADYLPGVVLDRKGLATQLGNLEKEPW